MGACLSQTEKVVVQEIKDVIRDEVIPVIIEEVKKAVENSGTVKVEV